MLHSSSRRYVVLDRDGTLNVEKHFLADPAELELLPGVIQGLTLLQRHGFGLVVVSNQSGIGRGIIDRDVVEVIHLRLRELLQREGIAIDGIYYCPHSPQQNCACRKPSPAMIYQAAKDLGFDPSRSIVVGDKSSDIEMGRRVNAVTVLVRTGYGKQAEFVGDKPDFIADDLEEAATLIVETSEEAS
jgi:D-glycero-D-manno-heptose 1,7-bisphosphate phosphatase